MTKADQFSFPCQFTGRYPDEWAGYTFLQKTEQGALHPGIDWNRGAGEQDFGDPVQCIADGVCVHTSEQGGIGYGEIVVVRHELTDRLYEFVKSRYGIDSHTLYSFYAHLKDSNAKVNQEISRGDLIGWVGKSGTTVSHLHTEIYRAVPGTTWRYWLTLAGGWDEAKIRKYYIDQFDLVVNQPSGEDEGEMTKIRMERDAHWNDKKAIQSRMGIAGDFSITKVMSWIDAHLQFERDVGEKDNQIVQLRKNMEELEGKIESKERELADLRTQFEELKKTIEAAKIMGEDAIGKVDSIGNDITEAKKDVEKLKVSADVIREDPWWSTIIEDIWRHFRGNRP